jgi:tRNA pseudouridine55 synthase
LAEDIGRRLNVGAHLADLRRTKAGKFDLSKAVTIEELEKIVAGNRLSEVLISMNEAVSHLPQVVLNEEETKDTQHGKRLHIEMSELADGEYVRMIDAAENLLAIGTYRREEKSVQPKLVLI